MLHIMLRLECKFIDDCFEGVNGWNQLWMMALMGISFQCLGSINFLGPQSYLY